MASHFATFPQIEPPRDSLCRLAPGRHTRAFAVLADGLHHHPPLPEGGGTIFSSAVIQLRSRHLGCIGTFATRPWIGADGDLEINLCVELATSDQIRAAWGTGDRIGALRIAARFFDRSIATRTFKRGIDAYNNPGFYRQLGKDSEQLVAAALQILAKKFSL